MRLKHLEGVALDVFPLEPLKNGKFSTGMESLENTILTPHLGGNTIEAQKAIGQEVSDNLVKFLLYGNTVNSVNFPEIRLEQLSTPKFCRLINIHKHVPGVLNKINEILANFNVEKQICQSKSMISYLVIEFSIQTASDIQAVYSKILSLKENISVRILYDIM